MVRERWRTWPVRSGMTDDEKPREQINSAVVSLRAGKVRFIAKAKITNGGLWAVSGLVSGILLSTAVLVWSSTGMPRKHPLAYGLLRRR